MPRRNYRQASRHRFENRIRHAFLIFDLVGFAWMNENVAPSVQFTQIRLAEKTAEMHFPGNAELFAPALAIPVATVPCPAMMNSEFGKFLTKNQRRHEWPIRRLSCRSIGKPAEFASDRQPEIPAAPKGNSWSGIPVRLIRIFSRGQPNLVSRSASDRDRARTTATESKRTRNFPG